MDEKLLIQARTSGLVTEKYVEAAMNAAAAYRGIIASLLSQRRLPDEGLSTPIIEQLLSSLAMMDSNNFPGHAGAGEREGRVFSQIIAQRYRSMTHGVGRSGDLLADQPKAAGSSLMKALTNVLCRDALRTCGLSATQVAVVAPMATGYSITLLLQTVKRQRPQQARYVVIPRIDQKTCVKCIVAAGLVPVLVPLRFEEASTEGPSSGRNLFVRSHVEDIEECVKSLAGGPAACVCILSVTSCFAPRVPDDPLVIGRCAARLGVPHIVNNAYGLQSPAICRRLNAALAAHAKWIESSVAEEANGMKFERPVSSRDSLTDTETRNKNQSSTKRKMQKKAPASPVQDRCRVDAVVQSGDKNFLVPVGGCVISGPLTASMTEGIRDAHIAESMGILANPGVDICTPRKAAELYPGRAGASATMDLFVTLLQMGRAGWRSLHTERLARLSDFHRRLKEFAERRGEQFLNHPDNDISCGMTLRHLDEGKSRSGGAGFTNTDNTESTAQRSKSRNGKGAQTPTELGAHLFRSAVSGARVVVPAATTTTVGGVSVVSYGTHHDDTPQPLLIMAVGIGMTQSDVDAIFARLEVIYPIAV